MWKIKTSGFALSFILEYFPTVAGIFVQPKCGVVFTTHFIVKVQPPW